jgi:glycosyltransferase involved in cell wall biosynthesis
MRSILNNAINVYHRLHYRLIHTLGDGLAAFGNIMFREDNSNRLLVLDDIFPQMLSAFRIAEYNAYLSEFQNSRVYSTATSFILAGETRSFGEVLKDYESRFPENKGKVRRYGRFQDLRSSLIYTIFINNAFRFIADIECSKSPLVFTLYPGGGFQLSDKESDHKLRIVLSSSSFRKVIVTQKISYDYIVDQGLCAPDQIEFIYGGVLPSHLLARSAFKKKRFPEEKGTFDICFVANKYMHRGVDKGYDIFIEVAKQLYGGCKELVFHVVGPYDKNDVNVTEIEDKIHFHGWKYTVDLPGFFANMDIILSPNRAFVLSPGSFDGFPTGACVEAGLCGVAVFCTDPLQQNIRFQDGIEIVITQPKVQEICDRVMSYFQKPEVLYELSAKGQQAFHRVFDLAVQMKPRLELLSNIIKSG